MEITFHLPFPLYFFLYIGPETLNIQEVLDCFRRQVPKLFKVMDAVVNLHIYNLCVFLYRETTFMQFYKNVPEQLHCLGQN